MPKGPKIVHSACQTEARFVKRTVVTQPPDQHWPKNVSLELPYCERCRLLLDISMTERVFER